MASGRTAAAPEQQHQASSSSRDRRGDSFAGAARSLLRRRQGCRADRGRDGAEVELSLLPFPPEVMSLALLYAGGKTLSQAACVSKAVHGVVTAEHWETAAAESRWLQRPTPDPSSFASPGEATRYWRRWSTLSSGAAGSPPGRVVVVGGNEISSVEGSDRTEAFVDAPYGKTITWEALPRMSMSRSAAGATVDRFGGVYVLGGWNSGGALNSCERLTHQLVSARQQRQRGGDLGVNAETPACAARAPALAPAAAAAAAAVSPAPLQRTTVGENGESTMSAAAGGGASAAAGESDWGWEALPPLRRQRCFLGAAFEPSGALLAMGGGTGPYRNDSAFETVEVLRPGADTWVAGPSMCQARCGMGVTALPDGKVFAVGGYGGELAYRSSVEVLDPCAERWAVVAPMKRCRTGVAATAGPNGRLYAVGGSSDGSHGLSSVETLDPREGKWSASPRMVFGRAFCCACFGASGCLYVVGGTSLATGVMRTVEVFDPRSEKWRVEERFGADDGGRAVTDASLVFQP